MQAVVDAGFNRAMHDHGTAARCRGMAIVVRGRDKAQLETPTGPVCSGVKRALGRLDNRILTAADVRACTDQQV